mgnify:CR=1 FL=1
MFILGLNFNALNYGFSSIDFKHYLFKTQTKPYSSAMLFGFGFSGTYNFKQSPLFLGFDLNFNNGSLNTKWDIYGFQFENTNNVNILKFKFPIGFYSASKNYIVQFGFTPQVWSIKFSGDNGYSSGSNIGFGFLGNLLFSISAQTFLGIGMFYDYVPSITTTFSEDNNLKVIPNNNQSFGFSLNLSFTIK